MEKAGWHFSHTAGKQVYGYQFLGIHLGAGDAGLCYDLERYEKESRTKVQMSEDILRLCGKRKRTSLSGWTAGCPSADFVHLCRNPHFFGKNYKYLPNTKPKTALKTQKNRFQKNVFGKVFFSCLFSVFSNISFNASICS